MSQGAKTIKEGKNQVIEKGHPEDWERNANLGPLSCIEDIEEYDGDE